MDVIESTLSKFDGGRVLDVATQQGRFVQVMKDSLKSYTEIVGIDIGEQGIEAARGAVDADGVSFEVMDAEELAFDDESFDTVAISASLHHMEDVGRVLGEMKRVLKPGGRFIVLEMHRDTEVEAERTSGELHRWAAEIDVALGRVHNRVFARSEILDHLAELDLSNVEYHECLDTESDPMEPEKLEKLAEVIGIVSERASGVPDSAAFIERGELLLERVRSVGASGEPAVLVVGEKQV